MKRSVLTLHMSTLMFLTLSCISSPILAFLSHDVMACLYVHQTTKPDDKYPCKST